MKNFYLVSLTLLSFGLISDVTVAEMADIDSRVGSMSVSELQDRRSYLLREEKSLMATQSSTQNPTTVKSVGGRLAEIRAELTAVQKALLAIVGVAAINSLTDDGSKDVVPPVITVNGSNPATVELGSTYSDAGATAMDVRHGSTSVSSSGTVDTSTVGSYTISYTATDKAGNSATASRTVNVVDTTAPVVTVLGKNPDTAQLGSDAYPDAGATATDLSGTVEVVTSGTVDTDKVGEYTLTYTATDASGNAGTATRKVKISDTIKPVFSSSSTFVVDENVTAIGNVTASDADTVTFTIGATTGPAIQGAQAASQLQITSSGALSFDIAPDYDFQVPDVMLN